MLSSSVKLLIDIAIQYNGANNGDLQASLNPMRARGMGQFINAESGETRASPLWFCRTDKAGWPRFLHGLYAITWESIDGCNGKIQVPSTKVASRLFENPTEIQVPKYCNQKDRLTIWHYFAGSNSKLYRCGNRTFHLLLADW